MKALQLRSPLNLSYVSTDTSFTSLELSIFINADVTAIDTTTTPDYFLLGEPIGLRIDFEIAELIRSKNNYAYKSDFYTTRDTATYVLVRAVLKDDSDAVISKQYNLIKVRDGYVERNEVQSLFSEIVTDPRNWSDNQNLIISAGSTDPFGGTDAYFIQDSVDSASYILDQELQLTGIHTLSVFIRGSDSVQIGNGNGFLTFSLSSGNVISASTTVIAYDVFKVGLFYKVSVVFNMALGDGFRIRETPPTGSNFCFIFNPTIMKGKIVNFTPSEVLLQSNTTTFSSDNIEPKFMLDRKESVAYRVFNYDLRPAFISDRFPTSYITTLLNTSFFLIDTIQLTPQKLICEPKYTPVKVSFINKFGVIQDLVFFKKREDSFNTNQQDFKANILRNGTYLPHTGQKQIINKQASAQVKLNTGFYPEDFNEVFKQLQYSTNYWIDDEPAILTGSNFAFKTSVNDKLINYSFDFEYANPDINDIR